MDTFLFLLEQIVFIVINLVVGVVTLRGYFMAVGREWPLFVLGISSILGLLTSAATIGLWLFASSDNAYEDGWLSIRFIGLCDAVLWTVAVCALVKRYVRLQHRVPPAEALP